jgi:hypothetical protein
MRRLYGAVLGLVVVGLAVVTGSANAAVTASVSPGVSTRVGPGRPALERASEAEARAAAVVADAPVEVLDQRTETQQVFANPDGTMTLQQATLPVRVNQGGTWVPVDPTLHVRRDGTVGPAATSTYLSLSNGGSDPLVSIMQDGKQLALGWPDALPTPVLSGPAATYRDVLPGVDLVVTADVLGFSEVLVVKTAQAAQNPRLSSLRFTTHTTGLTAQVDPDGNTDVVDSAGEVVFHAGTPLAWDSSGAEVNLADRSNGPLTGDHHLPMQTRINGGDIEVDPDQGLLTATSTVFPVYLDPAVKYGGARVAWTSVWATHPNSSFFNSSDIARVGHENQTGQTNKSYFQLNTAPVRGKHIISATFRTFEVHSWSCTPSRVRLNLTGGISAATTWAHRPGVVIADMAHADVAKGWSSACPQGGVDFNATPAVVQSAASNWSSVTLMLEAADEGDTNAWKKFRNNPVLEVNYNTPPPVPGGLTTDGLPCATGASRPFVGPPATPKLIARVNDADAQTVGAEFEWRTFDDAHVWTRATTKVAPDRAHGGTLHLAQTQALASGTYKWRVRAFDGIDRSAYSQWCEFTVDLTRPRQPIVTSTVYPGTPPETEPVYYGGIGVPGTFTLAPGAGDIDVVSYRYQLNTGPTVTVPASGTGKTATVTLTPTQSDLNTLHVVSIDRASNQSVEQPYQFYVRPVTFPTGRWTLDETTGSTFADASGFGRPAQAAGGVSHVAGRVDGAARFNGSDGSAGTSAPVLLTDQSFTVSAWVRLTNNVTNYGAVSQDGAVNSAFRLEYDRGLDRWSFEMASTDTTAETMVVVPSAQPPQLHVWTYLAGVYDKGANQMRLYVDGQLAGAVAKPAAWKASGGLQIGRNKWHGFALDRWAGDIDEVNVYPGVLTGPTIAAFGEQQAALVGYWKLNETGGATAADSSGAGRTAVTTAGASWTGAGMVGGSLALNGATASAATDSPVLRTDQAFTVSAWVRIDPSANPYVNYTVLSQEGVNSSAFKLQYIGWRGTWVFSMPMTDTADAAEVTVAATSAARFGVWTHLLGVYNPAIGNQLRLFVNGVYQGAAFGGASYRATGPLEIGRGRWGGFTLDWVPGAVDEVSVYQGVVGDDAIVALSKPCPGPGDAPCPSQPATP